MGSSATSQISGVQAPEGPWVRRMRFAAAVALVWAAVHFGVGTALVPPGLRRPVSLAASPSPLLAGLVLAPVLWVGSWVGARLLGGRQPHSGLLVVAVALGVWAYPGGTVDDWLELSQPVVAPPSGAPYVPLIAEYLYFGIVLLLAAVLDGWKSAVPASGATTTLGGRVWRALVPEVDPPGIGRGVLALATASVIFAVLMLVLVGKAEGWTRSGQVYFAIVLSAFAGVFLAKRVLRVHGALWYWPVPLVVGLVGSILAAARPALLIPGEYRLLNSIPAWGLVRPLPIQMLGAGIAVCLWTARSGAAGVHGERA